MRSNAGFTLIELVAVMLILAILAVVAVPQFVNLKVDAENAARDGIAGALASASTLNYAQRSLDGTKGLAVLNCSTAVSLLQGGALPTGKGYAVTAAPITNGATVSCALTGPTGNAGTTNFPVIGIN